MRTPRIRVHRLGTMALAAGVVFTAPAAGLGAAEAQKAPPRHVICSKVTTWIPADYTGGCFLSFSPAIRSSAYAAFAKSASGNSEWAGPNAAGAVSTMKCRRGGVANGMKLNRWQSGMCVWNEAFQHVGYDTPPNPHADHQWQCEVTVVVTSAPSGKMRRKGVRSSLQWAVSSTPLQDLTRTDGEWPFCNKTVPEDAWA